MQQVDVKFRDVIQVLNFVDMVNRYDAGFRFSADERVVNAKSLFEVCSLDLSKQMQLQCDSDDSTIRDQILGLFES